MLGDSGGNVSSVHVSCSHRQSRKREFYRKKNKSCKGTSVSLCGYENGTNERQLSEVGNRRETFTEDRKFRVVMR